MIKKRFAEYRALENEKGLVEQRADFMVEMEEIINKSKAETRALNDVESNRFAEIKVEIEKIDATLKAIEEQRSLENKKPAEKKKEERTVEEIDNEELRSIFEQRVGTAMNTATNSEGGFVVNKQLTGAIIKTLKDRSNVFGFFNSTTIPGIARLPKKASNGAATWADEKLTPDGTAAAVIPTLDILELGQNRLYRESALTQQMLNTEELDLRGFIIDDISESMSDAIEAAIFNGTGTKQPTGLIGGITKKVSVDVRGTITVDDLKKCKAKLKKVAQDKAKWFMNADTLLQIDLIKDTNGQYILHQDITSASGYTLLGLPVEVTDVMPTLADTGAKCVVVLASPDAYHINMQKSLSLYIYDDSTYKRAGLIGFGSDIYLDGKTKNDDVVAGIFNKAS